MAGPFTRQTVENWIADFLGGRAARQFEPVVQEYAPEFLMPLLLAPCEEHECEPGDLGEAELRQAFLGAVAAVQLPGSVRDRVPDVCAELLADLEQQGRLAGGRAAGLALRAARRTYLDKAGAPRAPVRRPAPKLSPNEPCPCGSGRKYKKCCQS